jgi:hypothetical protein
MKLLENFKLDKWVNDNAGTWYLEANKLSEIKRAMHYQEVLTRTFDAMGFLMHPLKVEISPVQNTDATFLRISPNDDTELSKDALSIINEAIANYPLESIYTIEVIVAMNIFHETAEHKLIQSWINTNDYISIYAGPEDPIPSVTFGLWHSLFRPNLDDSPGQQKACELNRELLEKALFDWEKKLGEIVDFEGPKGTFKYGYHNIDF